MTTLKALEKSLVSLAGFFYEPEERVNKDGEVIQYNLLGYTQRTVMQNICWKLDSERVATSDRLTEAQTEARVAAREHNGTEISENKLNKALSWLKRMQVQLSQIEDALEVAEKVYSDATGRTFKRATMEQAVPVQVNEKGMTQAQIEAARLLGESFEAENGGGVDAAEAEGVG